MIEDFAQFDECHSRYIAGHFDIGGQIHYKYGKGESGFYGDGSMVYGLVYNQIGAKAVADYNSEFFKYLY